MVKINESTYSFIGAILGLIMLTLAILKGIGFEYINGDMLVFFAGFIQVYSGVIQLISIRKKERIEGVKKSKSNVALSFIVGFVLLGSLLIKFIFSINII